MASNESHFQSVKLLVRPGSTQGDRHLFENLNQAMEGLVESQGLSSLTILGFQGNELRVLGEMGSMDHDLSVAGYLKEPSWVHQALIKGEAVWGNANETGETVFRSSKTRNGLAWPVRHRDATGAVLVLETMEISPPLRWIPFLQATENFWGALLAEVLLAIEAAELAIQLEQRTHESELMQRDTQRLNEELSDLRRTKEQFLANVGYELRTPLTSLLGFCEILLDQSYGPLSHSQVNFLESMQSSGQRLLRVVNDLVNLAQLERGNDLLALRDLQVEDLFKTLETEFAPLALSRTITFLVRSDPDLGLVTGDEERLRQVLFQLLDNAFKFTSSGGTVELTASATYGVGGEQGCEIAVQDTGIGIAPEERQRVFQAFAQVDESSSRSQSGLGVGLAIAQRIVSLHGARLALESQPDHGSRFFFTLPRNVPTLTQRVPLVMVIEDDPETCELLKMILSANGFDTVMLRTAESALEQLSEISGTGDTRGFPDVILLDIMLPQMNGFEFCKQLKAREDTRHIPVIMLSVLQDSASKLHGLEIGATDFLTKPVNRKELLARIKSLITQRREYEQILKEYNRAQRLAITDGLTGLFNHSYLVEELGRQVEQSRYHDQPLSVVMLDVDRFKHFNDTNGHLAGNDILKNLASVMEQNFRRGDLLARYGGEEFAILLPGTGKELATQLAERLRKRVEDYPFTARESQPLGRVTVSLGVSSFPTDTDDGSLLLELADRALYQAKEQGRNRVCVWEKMKDEG